MINQWLEEKTGIFLSEPQVFCTHSPFCRVAVLSIRHFVIRRFVPTPTMPQGVPSLQDNLSIQNIFNEIIFIADIEIYSKSDFLLF